MNVHEKINEIFTKSYPEYMKRRFKEIYTGNVEIEPSKMVFIDLEYFKSKRGLYIIDYGVIDAEGKNCSKILRPPFMFEELDDGEKTTFSIIVNKLMKEKKTSLYNSPFTENDMFNDLKGLKDKIFVYWGGEEPEIISDFFNRFSESDSKNFPKFFDMQKAWSSEMKKRTDTGVVVPASLHAATDYLIDSNNVVRKRTVHNGISDAFRIKTIYDFLVDSGWKPKEKNIVVSKSFAEKFIDPSSENYKKETFFVFKNKDVLLSVVERDFSSVFKNKLLNFIQNIHGNKKLQCSSSEYPALVDICMNLVSMFSDKKFEFHKLPDFELSYSYKSLFKNITKGIKMRDPELKQFKREEKRLKKKNVGSETISVELER